MAKQFIPSRARPPASAKMKNPKGPPDECAKNSGSTIRQRLFFFIRSSCRCVRFRVLVLSISFNIHGVWMSIPPSCRRSHTGARGVAQHHRTGTRDDRRGPGVDGHEASRSRSGCCRRDRQWTCTCPSLNGIDARRRPFPFRSDKIIALSCTGSRTSSRRCSGRCDAYVLKHCALEELERAICCVLRRKYLSAISRPGDRRYVATAGDEQSEAALELTPKERNVLQLIAEGNPRRISRTC